MAYSTKIILLLLYITMELMEKSICLQLILEADNGNTFVKYCFTKSVLDESANLRGSMRSITVVN